MRDESIDACLDSLAVIRAYAPPGASEPRFGADSREARSWRSSLHWAMVLRRLVLVLSFAACTANPRPGTIEEEAQVLVPVGSALHSMMGPKQRPQKKG